MGSRRHHIFFTDQYFSSLNQHFFLYSIVAFCHRLNKLLHFLISDLPVYFQSLEFFICCFLDKGAIFLIKTHRQELFSPLRAERAIQVSRNNFDLFLSIISPVYLCRLRKLWPEIAIFEAVTLRCVIFICFYDGVAENLVKFAFRGHTIYLVGFPFDFVDSRF